MPGRNRTGPLGMGPMTGRGAGLCSGYAGRENAYAVAGRGYGMGFGRGRGPGGGYRMGRAFGRGGAMGFGGYGAPYGYPAALVQPDPETEKQALSGQAKALQSELERVRNRMAEIEGDQSET